LTKKQANTPLPRDIILVFIQTMLKSEENAAVRHIAMSNSPSLWNDALEKFLSPKLPVFIFGL